jgi:APA family basic amino acid/polyamine antiporter
MSVFLVGGSPASRVSSGIGVAAAGAFAYSLWAIAGAGQEAIYWGFLLLVVGLPVYVFVIRRRQTSLSRD